MLSVAAPGYLGGTFPGQESIKTLVQRPSSVCQCASQQQTTPHTLGVQLSDFATAPYSTFACPLFYVTIIIIVFSCNVLFFFFFLPFSLVMQYKGVSRKKMQCRGRQGSSQGKQSVAIRMTERRLRLFTELCRK